MRTPNFEEVDKVRKLFELVAPELEGRRWCLIWENDEDHPQKTTSVGVSGLPSTIEMLRETMREMEDILSQGTEGVDITDQVRRKLS